ncbi:hypothetical protein Tco_0312859 [Tanacetum coccineum]
MESDEVIKSSVENLVQIPSESKGISDGGCDVPLCDNPTPLEAFKEHSETIVDSNNDSTSSDDDYPYGEDIDYVDASPLDAEIVSLEVVESVIPEVGGVDIDILLRIKDDILREKLLNVNLFIANIEALKDNPVPSSYFVIKSPFTFPNSFLEETNTFDNSLIESHTFRLLLNYVRVAKLLRFDQKGERKKKSELQKSKRLKIDIGRFHFAYVDDEVYYHCNTPVLSTKEPVDSLIMKDEHLDTIPAMESDEVIKSSVENLVQIPSESKGISDCGCDVPLCDNPTPLEAFKEHSETIVDSNNDSTSSDDDYPYGEDIDYVDASPPDAEIVSLEVVESVIPEVGGVDIDILLRIKDDILREKLLNVNLFIANIEALKDNPVPSSYFVIKSPFTFPNSFLEETNTFDNSLIESHTFRLLLNYVRGLF